MSGASFLLQSFTGVLLANRVNPRRFRVEVMSSEAQVGSGIGASAGRVIAHEKILAVRSEEVSFKPAAAKHVPLLSPHVNPEAPQEQASRSSTKPTPAETQLTLVSHSSSQSEKYPVAMGPSSRSKVLQNARLGPISSWMSRSCEPAEMNARSWSAGLRHEVPFRGFACETPDLRRLQVRCAPICTPAALRMARHLGSGRRPAVLSFLKPLTNLRRRPYTSISVEQGCFNPLRRMKSWEHSGPFRYCSLS